MAEERPDPDDYVPSNTLGASELNEHGRGCIWSDEGAANVGPTATLATVLDGTFTLLADDRRIRVTGSLTAKSDITGGIQVALYVDGVQRQRRNEDSLEGGKFLSLTLVKDIHLDAGDHTVAMTVGVSGVAGNQVTAVADGQTGTRGVHTLYVDDVSPSLVGS